MVKSATWSQHNRECFSIIKYKTEWRNNKHKQAATECYLQQESSGAT